MDKNQFFVITRSEKKEALDLVKIVTRITGLVNRVPKIDNVDEGALAVEVISNIKSGITTADIDDLTASIACAKSLTNINYLSLATRIALDNHKKNTSDSFREKIKSLYLFRAANGAIKPFINEKFYKYVEEHSERIQKMIEYSRDFDFNYFGFSTFLKTYSLKLGGKPVERIQDAIMRVAIAINMNTHPEDLEREFREIQETYDFISKKYYTHGTPIYINAGSVKEQFASCFLMSTDDDADAIMSTAHEMAKISKYAGGIGLHVHSLRSKGMPIDGTKGFSNGIVPFLKIFNQTICAFNQGGKRPGSAAIYLSVHHPDILEFLKLRLNDGNESERARDLFYAVWVPDIFMERLKTSLESNEAVMWSLFDPYLTGDLSNYYDTKDNKEYTTRYLELEEQGKYTRQVPIKDVWDLVYKANLNTGLPYICFSDNANRSQQNNIGVIKSSNLCAEIYEYSDTSQTAVCNLASVNLPKFLYKNREEKKASTTTVDEDHFIPSKFDYMKLMDATRLAVRNLNKILDKKDLFYPDEKTKTSNDLNRPLGIGIQGLADVYMQMRLPFDSAGAFEVNRLIFEHMYFAALSESTRICRELYWRSCSECERDGKVTINGREFTEPASIPKDIHSYENYSYGKGSHLKNGIFNWELYDDVVLSGRLDWESLRSHIKEYGVRNSLLIALMPTATTSQFFDSNECMEPITRNIYKRYTIAGEFLVINKHLVRDLMKLGLWSKDMVDYIIYLNGSIQEIESIPEPIKELYKTSFEIDPEVLVFQAIDRQPFIDQGQSLNWFIELPSYQDFSQLSIMAWEGGLKTGKYYLRTASLANAQQITIDPKKKEEFDERIRKNSGNNAIDFNYTVESLGVVDIPEEQICLVCSV